ncbi:MAG: hypothetical protein WBY44_17230 [Bryobacteraceae bacterium]
MTSDDLEEIRGQAVCDDLPGPISFAPTGCGVTLVPGGQSIEYAAVSDV